jgi:hypothetical protein
VITLLSLAACRVNPLNEALKGTLAPDASNQVITEYCQSCHIHRAFDALSHIPRVQSLYDREPYTAETQCRTCHMVHKDTWGTHRRKTLWPAEAAAQSS